VSDLEVAQGNVAERFASSRPGWTLAACTDVALPYWRVRARIRLMAHKRLGAIEEYTLRSISAGIVDPEDVGEFLGLGEALLRATTVGLLSSELLRWHGKHLALTGSGKEVLEECAVIKAEVRTVDIEWDGLLRRPVAPLSAFLEPRNVRARGIREIPPSPSAGPDAEEMRAHLRGIEALLRQLADRRADTFDLLDIGGIERRVRVFRPASALVYERDSARDVQVSLVVDGRISAEHEQAFATAGLARRLGVGPRGLASERRSINRVAKAAAVKRSRALPPHGHADPLAIALTTSAERLIIIGRELREAVVDDRFLEALDNRLNAGVAVTLAWRGRARDTDGYDASALKKLQELSAEKPGLRLGTTRTGPGALLSDARLAVVTSHDYLGHHGGPARDLHDARGVLVTDAPSVNAIAEILTATIAPLKDPSVSQGQAAR
jgi:hypothetical protein